MTHQSEQKLGKNVISPDEFRNLYKDQRDDLSVTTFKDVPGFSIVRNYPQGTEFFNDGNLIFIRIFLDGNNVCGGVEMVSGDGHKQGRYFLVGDEKYKKKVTGFAFYKEEELIFDLENKKIYNKEKRKSFSVNEFIDILVKNHLSDKLFFRRKISFIVRKFLVLIFWLSDRKYDIKEFFQDNISKSQIQIPVEKNKDPFFKYFKISKNILFLITMIVFAVLLFLQYHMQKELFSISNPIFIFAFFVVLFVFEKISIALEIKIQECTKNKEKKVNFIFRLHSFLYGYNRHSFRLKF